MSEVETYSRSSRRNAQKSKQTITGFSKKMNILVGSTVAAALLASAGIGVMMGQTGTVPLERTPEASSKLYFQDTPLLDGWRTNPSEALEGRGDLTASQNPAQVFSPDGKCSYIRQVQHLPSYQEGRTDSFITRQYLHEVAESNGASGNNTQILSVSADKGKLDFLSTSYLVGSSSATPDKKDDSPNTVYRSNAVRAIDKAVQIEGVKETNGRFGSDASKGIPVFFLSYECETQGDWSEDTWKALVESTKLSMYTEDVPAQPKPEVPTPENTGATPTETASTSVTPSSPASAEPSDERASPPSTTPEPAESTEE